MTTRLPARLAIALLAAASFWPPVHAQDAAEIDCNNQQTQADMTECSYRDFDEADKALNAVYKKAMASQVELDRQSADIGPDYVGAVKALKKAQRAWIDYRDGHCEGTGYQAAGGTMQPMLVQGCRATVTRNRTRELQELADGLGN